MRRAGKRLKAKTSVCWWGDYPAFAGRPANAGRIQTMYYVYILISSKDGRFYVGSTKDLSRRLEEHRSGKVDSTRHRRPLKLIGYEVYKFKQEALQRERYLKSSDARKEFRIRFKLSLDEILERYPSG